MRRTAAVILILLVAAGDVCLAATTKERTSYDYFYSGSKKYTELNNKDALVDLEKAITLNPDFKSALGLLIIVLAEEAILHYKAREYDEALPYLNKLLRYVPDDKEIRAIYEEVISRVEGTQAPPKEIVSAEERQSQGFLEAWRNYLRIKSQGYSLRDRLRFLKKVLASYSGTNIDLKMVREEISLIGSKLVKTEKEKDFNVRFNIGLRKYKTGRFSEALSVWKALEKDYSNHPTLESYIRQTSKELNSRIAYLEEQAGSGFENGRWQDAVRNWELIIELDISRSNAKAKLNEVKGILKNDYNKALRFYKQGLYHKAIAGWQDILDRYPNYPGVNAGMAKANDDLRTTKKSAKMNATEQYFREAEKYLARGRYVESVSMWKKILEISPLEKKARENILKVEKNISREGQRFYNAGKYFESQKKWKLLLKIDSGDRKAKEMLDLCMRNFEEKENKYFRSGEDAFNIGNYLAALDNFKKVLLVSPWNKKALNLTIESHLAQGIKYYRTQDLAGAIKQWDRALALNPGNTKAKTYKNRAKTKLESLKKLKGK